MPGAGVVLGPHRLSAQWLLLRSSGLRRLCRAANSFSSILRPRPYLVAAGFQTAAGFTLNDKRDEQPSYGVKVGEVAPDSPAARAGLRSGDIIVEANGKEIDGPDKLDALFSNWPRGGKQLTLVTADPRTGERLTHTFTPYTIGLHPTQVYESISMLLLFWMLLAFLPLKWRDGQVAVLLLVCYGIHRSLNELLRNDPRPVGFENYASLAFIALGVVLFAALCLRPSSVNK